jgi:hypothetical protein
MLPVRGIVARGERFADLAFHRVSCIPSAFATASPFYLKPGRYISKLLAPFNSTHHGQPSRTIKRSKEKAGVGAKRQRCTPLTLSKEQLSDSDPTTEKRPQDIKKEGPRQVRRSARISRLQKNSENRKPKQRHSSLSPEEAYTHSFWYAT